jgi:uncharacterized protein YaeQ
MHIWGCFLLVPDRDLKNSQDRASQGYLYSYSKRCALLWWFDKETNNVKHNQGASFLELDPLMNEVTPGQQLLKLEQNYKKGGIDRPLVAIDIGDCDLF